MINEDFIAQHWTEISERIHQRWLRFRASDLDGLRENIEKLVDRIQNVYGCARAQAELEFHEFRKSLRPRLQPSVARLDARTLY